MMSSDEQWQHSRYHTHLLILAMVVSATRTKSSAGESCTPLGNRNWSSKTFTSLVSVSYSSRLSVPTAKGHTGRIHDPPCWLGALLPSGQGPTEGKSASHRSDKAPGGLLLRPGSRLAPEGPSPSRAALVILFQTTPSQFSHWPGGHHGSSLTEVPL